MRFFRFALIAGSIAALGIAACGDDDNTVRPRLDGGTTTPDAGDGGPVTLSCGVTVPETYVSAAFATNAKAELDLRERFEELEDKMKSAEGASTTVVTAAELKALYGEGTPSLRAISTSFAQTTVDGYLDAFGNAVGKTWAPADADQDGGATAGGKYDAQYHMGPTGIDLRETTEKTLLGGALYNHVLGIVASPVNEAGIDRLLAAFGASTALANRTDADAGADADILIAEYASRRDDKSSATPGAYRKIKTALLTAKAAAAAGDKCKTELDAAIATYLSEWERVTYATAINYLNAAANKAVAVDGVGALHSFGEALGFVQSFKGIPQDKRKITDAQIDALLVKIGADSPYKLVLSPGDRALKLAEAINDIAAIYSFSATEVEAFKKNF